jgi:hypothetical protein
MQTSLRRLALLAALAGLWSSLACGPAEAPSAGGGSAGSGGATSPVGDATAQDPGRERQDPREKPEQDGKAEAEASRFVRIVGGPESPDGPERFETAVAQYRRPSDGVEVDLVAEIHIADAIHYEEIERRLATYERVLYELVADENDRPVPGQDIRDNGFLSMIYQRAADVLGLAFQLRSIDYSRKSFVHADMTPAELEEAFEEAGESILGVMVQQVFAEMSRERDESRPGQEPIDMVKALREGRAKLALRKLFVSVLADVDHVSEHLDDTVLVEGRNARALEVLDEQIAAGAKKLAIHYGAAHMPAFEKSLRERGFEKVGQDWVIAWRLDPSILEEGGEGGGKDPGGSGSEGR